MHFVDGNGRLALVYDPLDGSANIDVNLPVGSIFSVLACPSGARDMSVVLQPGTRQLAAGYAIYGPSTQLVLTVGRGTHGFTLDREIGNFVLTHPDIRVPDEARTTDQRLEPALLGAAGRALRRRVQGGQGRAARTRLQYALGRLDGGRRAPHPAARRHLHVSARPEAGEPRRPAAPAVRGETRWRCSSSRRAAPPRPAAAASLKSCRSESTSACR